MAAKIHGINVTDKSVHYNGSVGICGELMRLAGLLPYEQVDVVNMTNGARWTTYAIPEKTPGKFSLNGGGARLGEIGDTCVVLSYRVEERFEGANVVFCDPSNAPADCIRYENT